MPVARSPGKQSVDAIVQAIYGSLLEDMSFERCLRVLGGTFGAHISALHSEDVCVRRAGLEIFGELSTSELIDFSGAYATRWPGQNLWVERSFKSMLTKGYEDGDAVVTRSDLLGSEYYQHFLRPLNIRHGLGISVRNDSQSLFGIVSLNRSAQAGPFSADDLQLVGALRPHLVNAYAIYRRVGALQDRADSMRASFDRVPLGMLVLDLEGHVLDKNEEASRLLAENHSVIIAREGALRFANGASQARLRAALLRIGKSVNVPSPEALVIGGPGDNSAGALVLHLCALPISAGHLLLRGGRILAFLCELNRHSESQFATRVLRAALDLTPMEAAVVLSLRGHHDPTQVALETGLAISTVRSHFKHAFRKTGTTRQSELLQLVDRLLSAAPC